MLKLWQKYKVLDVETMDQLFRISATSKIDSVINSANNSLEEIAGDSSINNNSKNLNSTNNSVNNNNYNNSNSASKKIASSSERRKRETEDEDFRRPSSRGGGRQHQSSPVSPPLHNHDSPQSSGVRHTTAHEISKVC